MLPPAIIIHSAADAGIAVGAGRPLVLLSAPGAGCYGGARWWRLVVDSVDPARKRLIAADILDCGAEAGRAVEALREGCRLVVLDPASLAFDDVADRAHSVGARLLALSPPALDLGMHNAHRRLAAWLDGATGVR